MQERIKAIPADTPWGNSTAQMVLKVAEELLAGEIALLRSGINARPRIEYLQQRGVAEDARKLQRAAGLGPANAGMAGTGAAEDGQFAEAEKVYRDELVKHPKNGRALFGLSEALESKGKTGNMRPPQTILKNPGTKADTPLAVGDLYFPT